MLGKLRVMVVSSGWQQGRASAAALQGQAAASFNQGLRARITGQVDAGPKSKLEQCVGQGPEQEKLQL